MFVCWERCKTWCWLQEESRRSLRPIGKQNLSELSQHVGTALGDSINFNQYLDEKDRSTVKIFRLHNITFSHAIATHKNLRNVKSLTIRKLFGQYYHSLINHAAEVYRITSLTSIHAEDEERAFQTTIQIMSSRMRFCGFMFAMTLYWLHPAKQKNKSQLLARTKHK